MLRTLQGEFLTVCRVDKSWWNQGLLGVWARLQAAILTILQAKNPWERPGVMPGRWIPLCLLSFSGFISNSQPHLQVPFHNACSASSLLYYSLCLKFLCLLDFLNPTPDDRIPSYALPSPCHFSSNHSEVSSTAFITGWNWILSISQF